ncbi:MAG: GLPGLI family protein [Candidatus Symbiothrix sp.]|jgi:GLPGLI family protein|nr:GLPGLI family protein [Candidatus Symbiothrix sp.]
MKRVLLLLAVCFASLCAYPQLGFIPSGYETLDTTALRVFYEFKYPPALRPVKQISGITVVDSVKTKELADYMILEIGESGISKFYSDNKRRLDSILTDVLKNPQKALLLRDNIMNSGIQKADEHEIYKNYPVGKMTVTDQAGLSAFLTEENLNEIQWQMTTDTMTCLKYLCQKATCDFRGRHYEAWFAPDLPINDGPWKFTGLPGLILYATDSENQYIFKAVGLENTRYPVRFTKREYVKTTRKEVDKIKKRFAEDPLGQISNSVPGVNIPNSIPLGNGVEINRNDLKMIYDPMELE